MYGPKVWRQKLRANPEQLRLAAIGAGVIGDPALVGDLIILMEIDEITRVAGEAFSMITGVDLEYEDLDGEAPEGFESGPNEAPEDEDVAMDPDEDLPWPDPTRVAQWWDVHCNAFKLSVRHLRGKKLPQNLCRIS